MGTPRQVDIVPWCRRGLGPAAFPVPGGEEVRRTAPLIRAGNAPSTACTRPLPARPVRSGVAPLARRQPCPRQAYRSLPVSGTQVWRTTPNHAFLCRFAPDWLGAGSVRIISVDLPRRDSRRPHATPCAWSKEFAAVPTAGALPMDADVADCEAAGRNRPPPGPSGAAPSSCRPSG